MQYVNKWNDLKVEEFWDSISSIYIQENLKVHETHVQRFEWAAEHLNVQNNLNILNVQSRDCEAVDYLHKIDPTVVMVNADISSNLMQLAKNLRPNIIQTKIDTFSKLPYVDSSFDRILTLETLEHVAEPLSFLKECYRVSKKNALMVLSCPPLTSEIPYQIYTFIFGGHGEGPHRFLSSKEVKKLLKLSGWSLIKHEGTLLFPVGPKFIRKFGEWIIKTFQKTWISEFGIRQFYVCNKQG